MVTGATAPIVPCFCVGGRSEPAVHAAPPHTDGMTIMFGRAAPSQTLPPGGGLGKPGFPYPCVRARPSRGRGDGGTWFPYVHVRRSCAWRTTPAATGPGARASRPRHGSAGTVPAPSLTLPHWEREPGSSPQRGRLGGGLNTAHDGHLNLTGATAGRGRMDALRDWLARDLARGDAAIGKHELLA